MTKNKEVDKYISAFPENVKNLLEELRNLILKTEPKAEEIISYMMPAYKYNGMLVYFAGYKNHIGFYPTASPIVAFKKELSVYKTAKGSIQFPIDQPLPKSLITKIVKYKVKENEEKTKLKKNLKTCSKGHKFYKSSDCPTCPICEAARKPKEGFLSLLSAPARRALESKKIKTLEQLSKYSEKEITALHGMGPSTLPKLKAALKKENLSFKK